MVNAKDGNFQNFVLYVLAMKDGGKDGARNEVTAYCRVFDQTRNQFVPVVGADVLFQGALVFSPPGDKTDADGKVQAKVAAQTPGKFEVMAVASGGTPDMPEIESSPIILTFDSVTRADFMARLIVTKNGALADDREGNTVEVQCTALNRTTNQYVPVAGASVVFSGPVTFFPDQPKTDEHGKAKTKALSDYPGQFTIVAEAVDGTPRMPWTNSAPAVLVFMEHPGENYMLYVDASFDSSGEKKKLTAFCYLWDGNPQSPKEPVAGADIEFSAAGLYINPASGSTNTEGRFTADVFSYASGVHQVTATASSAQFGNAVGQVSIALEPIYRLNLSMVSINPYGSQYRIDAYLYMPPEDRPAPGIRIYFSAQPEGSFNPPSGITDGNGYVSTIPGFAPGGWEKAPIITATAGSPPLATARLIYRVENS